MKAATPTLSPGVGLSKTKGAVRNLTANFLRLRSGETPIVEIQQESDTRERYDPSIPNPILTLYRFKPLKSNFLMALNSYDPGYTGVSSPQETMDN